MIFGASPPPPIVMAAPEVRYGSPADTAPPAPLALPQQPPTVEAPPPHVVGIVGDGIRRIRGPNASDMARFYPERAQRMRLAGDVTLVCTIAPAGVLTDCAVADEQPPGFGFALAAVQISSRFKYAPVANPIRHPIHIHFQLPPD